MEADAAEATVVEDKAEVAGATGRAARIDGETKPTIAARQKTSQVREGISGAAIAKEDIHSGNFRILFAGDSWPAGKPLLDVKTGFRIALIKNGSIKIPENEVEAYNQTMRDWYHENKGLSN